jgi:HAD superfamily phosphatase (TIGR01668 family)
VVEIFNREDIPRWLRRFCPRELADSVVDLSPEHLKSLGLLAIGIDLDNTLTPWKSYELGNGVEEWLQQVKESGLKMCIISNSRRKKRLAHLSQQLAIPYVKGPMKPRRGILRSALKLVGVKPEEMAMIGDQMFTDVWGGNRMGMYTIWVRPIHSHEFFGTKLSRQAERWIVWLLSKHRKETTSSPGNK